MWSRQCASRGTRVQLRALVLETLQEEHRDRLTVCASTLAGRMPSWGYGFSFRRKSVRALSGEPRDCLAGIAVRKLDRPWNGVRPLRVQFEVQVCVRSHASPYFYLLLCCTLLYFTLLYFLCKHLPLDASTRILSRDNAQRSQRSQRNVQLPCGRAFRTADE